MEEEKCLYQTVYDTLQERIRSGRIRPGERLPAEKALAEEFDVSRITIQKAMSMLVQDGYIFRRPGRGSFASMNADKMESRSGERNGDQREAFDVIGLVMEDFSASFGIEMLKAIEDEAEKKGYHLCMKRSMGDQLREKKMLESLMKMKVAGVIVMPTHGQHYNTEILKMVGDGMPVVFVDRYLEGLPVPFVGTDNEKAVEELVQHLLDRGYRRMALFTAPETEADSLKKRIRGYRKMVARHLSEENGAGYLLDSIRSTIPDLKSEKNTDDDAEKIAAFLKAHPDVEVVIAAEFDIAVLTEKVCRQIGIRVPQDLEITCFDGPLSAYGEYTYTHVRQDEEQMGKRAVQILARLIRGESLMDRVYMDAKVVPGTRARG